MEDLTLPIEIISTERLTGHRISMADRIHLAQMHHESKVMAKLGGVRTEAESLDYIIWNKEHWQRHGFGLWLFHAKSTDDFVAQAGIRTIEIAGAAELELVYALMPRYWGQGLATEMGAACIRVAFEWLKADSIISFAVVNNLASIHVMEKLGFQYEKHFSFQHAASVLYRLTAKQYFS